MARYHVNPETGEPGVCKSETACRFGSEAAHYQTEGDARQAYEASMVEQEFRKISFKPGEIEVASLDPGLVLAPDHARLPAGTYFIGDPCYSAGQDDQAWQEWVRVAEEDSRGFTDPMAGASFNGFPVLGVNTMYGDGGYPASNGFTYSVDAGMVGAVPEELIDKMGIERSSLDDLGTWETFTEDFDLTYGEDGTIAIGWVAIYTGADELEPDEDVAGLYDDDDYDRELL